MKNLILNLFGKYVLGILKWIFKILKIIYFDYILKLFNTLFDTLIIIAQKFSSTVFLLCLVITIVFCIDFGHALWRTWVAFKESGGLEVSPLLVDKSVYVTTISVYGAKSMLRKFADMKKIVPKVSEKDGED